MFAGLKALIGRTCDRMFPRAWIAFRILRRDRNFEPEYWLVPRYCDPSKTAIDIGANMGEYSYLMARHARDVVAFEPNAVLNPALRRRLPSNVRIEPFALSREAGTVAFRVVAGNTGVATIEPGNALGMIEDPSTVETRQVETRTLDSFSLADVSLIKIDVEGHEEAVIDGALETLARCRPALLIESEDRHNAGAPNRLIRRLAAANYDAFVLRSGALVPISAATATHYNYVFLPKDRPRTTTTTEKMPSDHSPHHRVP